MSLVIERIDFHRYAFDTLEVAKHYHEQNELNFSFLPCRKALTAIQRFAPNFKVKFAAIQLIWNIFFSAQIALPARTVSE